MDTFTAVYDACVLYPAQLRNLLMWLALSGLFRARWTNDIHDEWTRNVLRNHPDVTPAQVRRIRTLMDTHVLDALVSGYEPLIPSLVLPDPDDRHVLAAAIRAGAGVIVTSNLSDFPPERLAPYGIEARHPDDFILDLADLDPAAVCRAARDHRASLRRPAKSPEEYLNTLLAAGLSKTVAFLRRYVADI
jgi:hypothetical protein